MPFLVEFFISCKIFFVLSCFFRKCASPTEDWLNYLNTAQVIGSNVVSRTMGFKLKKGPKRCGHDMFHDAITHLRVAFHKC
jgi:hypothetical protein